MTGSEGVEEMESRLVRMGFFWRDNVAGGRIAVDSIWLGAPILFDSLYFFGSA